MGLIDELKRITVGRAHRFLETVEDPETVLPRLMRELDGALEQAVQAEAKALSALRAAQSRLDETLGRLVRLTRGAELALRLGDEQTARDALAEQVKAEGQQAGLEKAVELAQQALTAARDSRQQLKGVREDLLVRKNELLERARRVGQGRAVVKPWAAGEDLLAEVARMEAALAEDEAIAEVRTERPPASIEERLRQLERTSEVEARLAALKATRSGQGKKA